MSVNLTNRRVQTRDLMEASHVCFCGSVSIEVFWIVFNLNLKVNKGSKSVAVRRIRMFLGYGTRPFLSFVIRRV
jgi:hypothetical protein